MKVWRGDEVEQLLIMDVKRLLHGPPADVELAQKCFPKPMNSYISKPDLVFNAYARS